MAVGCMPDLHLLLETPEPSLVTGMKWLMGVSS